MIVNSIMCITNTQRNIFALIKMGCTPHIERIFVAMVFKNAAAALVEMCQKALRRVEA